MVNIILPRHSWPTYWVLPLWFSYKQFSYSRVTLYIEHANFQGHWFNYGWEKNIQKIINFCVINPMWTLNPLTVRRRSVRLTVIMSRDDGCSMQTGRRGNNRACAPCSSRQYSSFTNIYYRCLWLYQYSSVAGKHTAVFRSECSDKFSRPAYALQPPSRGANTVLWSVEKCHELNNLFCLFYKS